MVGAQHLTYTQTYQGLPVYGAMMKVHFNAAGQIAVVNGTDPAMFVTLPAVMDAILTFIGKPGAPS